jgi:hypothetical protein
MLKNDIKSAEKWVLKYCSAGFIYTSKDKVKYNRKAFLEGLRQQMKAVKTVETSKFALGTVSITGSKLSVKSVSDFVGTLVFDGRTLVLTDKSETKDTWVRSGSDWKLSSILQIKADTQMRQKS